QAALMRHKEQTRVAHGHGSLNVHNVFFRYAQPEYLFLALLRYVRSGEVCRLCVSACRMIDEQLLGPYVEHRGELMGTEALWHECCIWAIAAFAYLPEFAALGKPGGYLVAMAVHVLDVALDDEVVRESNIVFEFWELFIGLSCHRLHGIEPELMGIQG